MNQKINYKNKKKEENKLIEQKIKTNENNKEKELRLNKKQYLNDIEELKKNMKKK